MYKNQSYEFSWDLKLFSYSYTFKSIPPYLNFPCLVPVFSGTLFYWYFMDLNFQETVNYVSTCKSIKWYPRILNLRTSVDLIMFYVMEFLFSTPSYF